MGSAAKYQAATIAAFNPTSRCKDYFVTHEWLFTEQINNISKLSTLEKGDQLCFIAIDKAHLIYEWHLFRPMYTKCQVFTFTISKHINSVKCYTVTSEIMAKLQSFLRNPTVVMFHKQG